MGWLQRLFGIDKNKAKQSQTTQNRQAQPNQTQATRNSPATSASTSPSAQATSTIPPERVGLDGEYDQSGLAKRVALAFDEDPTLDDIETLYVAQTSGTVVLKGKVPNQQILDKMVAVARKVNGATQVDTTQVTIG